MELAKADDLTEGEKLPLLSDTADIVMTMLKKRTDLLRECHKELKQYYIEAGPCDHSVGICACDLLNLIERIEAEIKV